MKPEYTRLLSPKERVSAMKLGAMLEFADKGIGPSSIDGFVKQAVIPAFGGFLEGTAKAIVVTALLTGVPLGVAAHLIGNQVSSNRRQEREKLDRIRYYRNVGSQLEQGLAGPQVVK